MIKKSYKTLDKLNDMFYIIIEMNKLGDTLLIKFYTSYCIENDFNQSRMAREVGMSKGWASLLVNGKIKSLRFDTRNRIKAILGIQ